MHAVVIVEVCLTFGTLVKSLEIGSKFGSGFVGVFNSSAAQIL